MEKREILYNNFMSQLRNEELWKNLNLSEKLHLIRQFKKIYENAQDGDIEIFQKDPEFLYNQIGKRGINRFKRINEFVDSLNRIDLSTEEKRKEFKQDIRNKLHMAN